MLHWLASRSAHVHERMPVPFERARTLLIYGTILRRVKRRKAAREATRGGARDLRGGCLRRSGPTRQGGACPIGGRAASGAVDGGRAAIAELVAVGKSNKETAAALFHERPHRRGRA